MKTKKYYVCKGFTLVELLIVIVVIGVLAAMMILSSTEAISSAKATKIISDLTQLKKAATAWYLDNYDRIVLSNNDNFHVLGVDGKDYKLHALLSNDNYGIKKYLGNGTFSLNGNVDEKKLHAAVGGYSVYLGNSNTRCYVVYRITADKDNNEMRLKNKLKGRAKSTGLLYYEWGKEPKRYNGEDVVVMEVFRLQK